MAFYISASGLRNFLDCRERYYLSNTLKVERPVTIPMALGIGAHNAIEKNEDGDLKGMHRTFQDKFLTTLEENKVQINNAREKVHRYLLIGKAQLRAYNNIVKDLEPLSYGKEFDFRVELDRNIILVGKIDQIRAGDIYDIKTGEYPPSEEMRKKDLQFTIYAYAYKQIVGKTPDNLYWLRLGYKEKKREKKMEGIAEIIEMKSRTKKDFDEMCSIIYNVVQDIKDERFYKSYGYLCRTCLVKDFCIEQGCQQ